MSSEFYYVEKRLYKVTELFRSSCEGKHSFVDRDIFDRNRNFHRIRACTFCRLVDGRNEKDLARWQM